MRTQETADLALGLGVLPAPLKLRSFWFAIQNTKKSQFRNLCIFKRGKKQAPSPSQRGKKMPSAAS
jgi:hypothetical protein